MLTILLTSTLAQLGLPTEARLLTTLPLSPRPFDVVEAQQSVGPVEDDADRIEADRVGRRPGMGALVEPCASQSPQTCALAGFQPCEGLILRAEASATVTGAFGLDLCEHEGMTVAGDQVDLAVAGPHVTCDDDKPESPKVADRKVLAASP